MLAFRHHPTRHRRRARLAGLAVIALSASALAATSQAPAGAAPTAGGGGGAAATVGNGLTTTDLAAVGMSPSSLASTLVGPGVSVSNVTFTGAPAQAGTIHLADPAVVSFNDGVILSSGSIADVVGPNKSDGITGDMAGADDADLNALIASTQTVNPITFDAASLEFDFVPTADHVYFTYTWGSDEYLEWVNLFNDVFAFYVNGQNCATLPDGSPISIDTINDAVNPALFRDNSYSSPPPNPINIESDGLSVEMICSAAVQPGQVNHMKLAIADTSDQILDSVVMIKAHSLSTTPPESCNDHVDNDGDDLIDLDDDSCSSTVTPPPPGGSGIGSSGSAPPFTGNEGTPIPLDASALDWTPSSETLSTTWAVDGINGTTGSCSIDPADPQPIQPDGSIAVVTAICPNEGEYVARVDGIDIEGKSSYDSDVDFFVHNAPPAVAIASPTQGSSATVGSTVALEATIVDPGAADAVTCEISWGDGTAEPGSLADGTCTGAHAYGATGQQLISVTATDDAGDSAASATLVSIAPAGVTVTSSANPSAKGQPVALTATTTLGTTGTMSFYDGATLLGNRSVVGGAATFTTTTLGVGSHAITATYKKSSVATPTTSEPIDQQVQRAATTTTLTSNVDPSVSGQSVTLRASVATIAPGAGAPSGVVSLYDDDVLVASRTMSGAAASFVVRPTVGEHAFRAVYEGSTNHDGSSTIVPLLQQVDQAATTTVLTSSPNPSAFGQSVVLRTTVASVAPGSGTPAGEVTIYDGDVVVAVKALSRGTATLVLRPTVGTHRYTASYGGSSTHLPSAAASSTDQVVDQASTTITMTSSANPSVAGQAVSIRAVVRTVAPGSGTPTGEVDIYDGSDLVATRTLTNGSASLSLRPTVGSHSYTAVYRGAATHQPSSTAVGLVQVVDRAATKVIATSTYATTTYGHAGTITAAASTVSPGYGVPTGVVSLYDDGTRIATLPLVSGKASLALASLPRGVHAITVTYDGSDERLPSTSATPLIVTIT